MKRQATSGIPPRNVRPPFAVKGIRQPGAAWSTRKPHPNPDLPKRVAQAVMDAGGPVNARAIAEETGLPEDMVLRLAASAVVNGRMVEAGIVDHEDAIRMGSAGLVASLRLLNMSHASNVSQEGPMPLQRAAIEGLRRVDVTIASPTRPVAASDTPCPRCGTRSQVGCMHQRALPAD